jgi:hypothetical protein
MLWFYSQSCLWQDPTPLSLDAPLDDCASDSAPMSRTRVLECAWEGEILPQPLSHSPSKTGSSRQFPWPDPSQGPRVAALGARLAEALAERRHCNPSGSYKTGRFGSSPPSPSSSDTVGRARLDRQRRATSNSSVVAASGHKIRSIYVPKSAPIAKRVQILSTARARRVDGT